MTVACHHHLLAIGLESVEGVQELLLRRLLGRQAIQVIDQQGIALADFHKDPVLRQQIKGFRHLYGQPPEVRRAFEEAMGIAPSEAP